MLINAFYRSEANENKPFRYEIVGTAYFNHNIAAKIFNQKTLAQNSPIRPKINHQRASNKDYRSCALTVLRRLAFVRAMAASSRQ
jgi:hypothetical protein